MPTTWKRRTPNRTVDPTGRPSEVETTASPGRRRLWPRVGVGEPTPPIWTPTNETSGLAAPLIGAWSRSRGDALATPGMAVTVGAAAVLTGLAPVKGPLADAGYTKPSAPSTDTKWTVSSWKLADRPDSTSVMASTSPVPMTVMITRRCRHCRSRSAATNMAGQQPPQAGELAP